MVFDVLNEESISIRVWGNNALTGLLGLDNIEANSIDGLYIYDNISLSTCEVERVCDYLDGSAGNIVIQNNASGCNSPEEVEDACWTKTEEIRVSFIE